MIINANLFFLSILTIVFRGENVLSFLYRYTRLTGHDRWLPCSLTDQIPFCFCRGLPSEHLCLIVFNFYHLFQRRSCYRHRKETGQAPLVAMFF